MSDIQSQILDRFRRSRRPKVFTPKDFLDLGGRDAVDQSLSRLARGGTIQRLGRGLYELSRMNTRLGIPRSADIDAIAAALARQTGSRIAPSGAVAANRLGLSTQVPANPVYLSDGRSRKVRVGNLVFVVKHVPPKDFPAGDRMSATVFLALRFIGRDAVNPQAIARIRRNLSPTHRAKLSHDARFATDWIADTARRISHGDATRRKHG